MNTGKKLLTGKIVFALAAWAAALTGALGQVAATAQKAAPAAPQAAVAARTAADDATSDFTLANGLKVIHRFVKGNEVVAARVYFRGGARNITEKNAGIETLLFEVAQAGTKNFTKSQINRELARMGTVVNSGGGYDYSVLASLSVRQHFDRSWQLLTDMALNPTFDEKEVALERDRLVNALRQEGDDPETYVTSQSEKLLYAAHPYSNRPFGTVESVGKLTAAELKAYHAAHLSASRLLVVVVGNVTQDEVRRKVEMAFGRLPRGDYKPEPPPAFKAAEAPEFKLIERGVPTYYIRGVFAAPSIGHPDYPALMVATNIIYQQFFQEVRVQRNLSYAPNIELLTQGANSGFISVSTPKPNEAIRVMFDQIELIQKNTIRKEALPEILTGFLTTYYRNLETNDAQAARLGEYELLAGDWRKALTWIDDVNKVTPEDINRVAVNYLHTFRFAVIGDKAAFDPALFTSR
jgi:zinc protease